MILSAENIMFAENKVQAQDFMNFAKLENQNTCSLNENISLLVRTQEKVIKLTK